jgi:hypothetical protein
MIVASIELRLSSDQYTSSRWKMSTNSSSTSAATTPKTIAPMKCTHGRRRMVCRRASLRTSASIKPGTSPARRASSATISVREQRTLHSFIRATGSFLEGMARYIVRENPSPPVFAYDGIMELTEENAGRIESQLRDFLEFYRDQWERYDATVPELDAIFEPATANKADAEGRAP